MISVIENLDALTALDSLNLNQNVIQKITGLSKLTQLNTLLLQNNKLKDLDDVRGVLECPSISVLDLSKNQIEDEGIVDLLAQLPKLKVLYLKDNPVVGEIQNYRKRVISRIPTLTYLDDRPVFEDERRTCDAWGRGGKVAEAAERKAIDEEKASAEVRNYKAFEKMIREAREEGGLEEEGDELTEEKEKEKASSADESEEAKEQAQPPPLEEEEEEEAAIVRPTTKITFTHTPSTTAAPAPATAAAAAQPLLSLTNPASAANAATSRPQQAQVSTAKRTLIEVVDDAPAAAPEEKTNETNTTTDSKPDRTMVQQLD